MADEESQREDPDPEAPQRAQDRLLSAIERTMVATAAETRERAGELLDEATRRGQGAREASAGLTQRVVEAVQDLRLATGDDVRQLERTIAELERRVAALEERPPPRPDPPGE